MTEHTFFSRPSPKARKLAAAALGLLALSACNHTDVAAPSVMEPVVRNEVQMVRLAHAIKPEDDGTDTLSVVTYADLGAFLQSVRVGSADTIMLDAGDAPAGRVADIAHFLHKQGFIYGGQAVLGATPEKGTIMLYVERYVVTPPDCGKWPREVSGNQGNNTSAYLSCANIGNLGLMVANPRDLIAGQGDSVPGTPDTAVHAIQGWQATPPGSSASTKKGGSSSSAGGSTGGSSGGSSGGKQ